MKKNTNYITKETKHNLVFTGIYLIAFIIITILARTSGIQTQETGLIATISGAGIALSASFMIKLLLMLKK